ncbi:MAG: SMC-Scp complex subunit ScpB [Pirellulales bacterium]
MARKAKSSKTGAAAKADEAAHIAPIDVASRAEHHEPERAVAEPPADLGLDRFASAPDDVGLSLEELSEAYASLLSDGADPYATPSPDDDFAELGDAFSDETAPPDSAAAELGSTDDDESLSASGTEAARAGVSDPPAEVVAERLPAAEEVEISPRTILEAMLFVGNPNHEPLTAKHVASLMRGVRAREVDDLVVELNETYAAEQCAYTIESVGAGYRLVLRPEMAALRDRFYGRVKDAKLSQQAIDVLAIVAYNQPLTRPEIDKLRNASSGGVLSQLVRRGLLRVERPDKKPREPIFYTTNRFLELFGLESLDDLPKSLDAERAL